MAPVPPVPEHLTTVTPRLVVPDGAAAIDFYAAAFAAERSASANITLGLYV